MRAGLWIVHRDPRWREALRRLVGGASCVADPREAGALADAAAPRVVLLGASGDFEAELAWAHAAYARLAAEAARRGARAPVWLILAEPRDVAEARRLFDALRAEVVPITSDATELRRRLRAALARRDAAALSERSRREALAARFQRWLGDLDPGVLLAALDPARRTLPVLVRGEPGTGRGLLARMIHLQAGLGGAAPGAFASVAGAPGLDAPALLAGLVPELSGAGAAAPLTVCIEDVDALDPATQRRLASWIEDGPPPGTLAAAQVRWMATAGDPLADDRLAGALASALAGIVVRIPPLRERPEAIDRIAAETLRAWGALYPAGRPAPRLSDEALAALRACAWPGNARELEAVVRRTLATTTRDPIPAEALAFEEPVVEIDAPATGEPQARDADAGARAEPSHGAPPASDAGRSEARVAPLTGEAERDAARAERRDRASDADAERARPGEPASERPAPAPRAASAPPAGEPRPRAAAEPPSRPAAPPAAEVGEPLRRLAGAVAHEVGNPLVGIRTFAQMLPSRFDDPAFRAQFAERVEADTRRIEAVVETLARLGSLPPPARDPVDVSALIARLLELQAQRIAERRLVVLEELDRDHPLALGDAEQLRFAFGLLLEETIGWLPEQGDLYVATRRRAPAEAGAPEAGGRLRILLRSRVAGGQPDLGLRLAENTLAVAAVEAVVRAHGGSFAIEAGDAGETLVLIELPAP